MPKFETALFDFDGTIADTLPLIYAAFDAAITPSLGRRLSNREVRALFGPPDHDIIRLLVPNEHQEMAIATYVDFYAREHHRLASAFVDMNTLLRQCRAHGIKVGVVTGKSRITAEISLQEMGISDAYDVLVAGDDVEQSKPHPEGILTALDALGKTNRAPAVYIGDSAADVLAGRAAGIKAIAVTWGSPDHEELRAAQPDVTCDTVAELADALGVDWN